MLAKIDKTNRKLLKMLHQPVTQTTTSDATNVHQLRSFFVLKEVIENTPLDF